MHKAIGDMLNFHIIRHVSLIHFAGLDTFRMYISAYL